MNLMGSISLKTMKVTIGSYETLDSLAMTKHFKKLRETYPNSSKVHLILDCGSYNTSQKTQDAAKLYDIVLHYLPAYSPNLNLIERLCKVMNEYVRNNRFFKSVTEFKTAILYFFDETWNKIAHSMNTRINDNFQTLKKIPPS